MPADSKIPGVDGHKRPHKGRGGFKPTDDQRRVVLAAKSMGIENAGIARALGIDRDTLAKHFPNELSDARDVLHAKIAGKMVGMALDDTHKDCQRAGQFILQAQFGWATQQQLNFGVKGAGPADAAPSADQVLPAKITVEFVSDRPKGLPGAPPEDRLPE